MTRECGDCTACCVGKLSGNVYGHVMKPGLPCHFLGENRCSIYEKRPDYPCKSFVCAWLADTEQVMPEWMKPSMSKVIVKESEGVDGKYWKALECGQKMDSTVLSWLIQHCMANDIPLVYEVDGSSYYIGPNSEDNDDS